MSTKQHEAMIRAYIEEVFNGHHLDGLEKYWAEDLTSHWMGQETLRGLPAWREGMVGFLRLSRCLLHPGRPLLHGRPRRLARELAGDPTRRLARHRSLGPHGDMDGHHHRPLCRR